MRKIVWRTKAWLLAVFMVIFSGVNTVAMAVSYPDKPIKLIIGYAPGGGIDILARYLAKELGDVLDQSVIVENKAGASGSIAARALIGARPDGYTIFMADSSNLVAPALQNAPYDPLTDFEPIGSIGALAYGVAVHPSASVHSLAQLVEAIKGAPDGYQYGTPGVGNIIHLGVESLKMDMNLDMVHVPYKGGGPMLSDLMSGHIPLGFTSMVSLVSPEQSGHVRLIAVSSKERSPLYPDVPALSEILDDFEAVSNAYLVAPSGTPNEIIQKLNAALNQVMETQEAESYFQAQGTVVQTGTSAELSEQLVSEVRKWNNVVHQLDLSLN